MISFPLLKTPGVSRESVRRKKDRKKKKTSDIDTDKSFKEKNKITAVVVAIKWG